MSPAPAAGATPPDSPRSADDEAAGEQAWNEAVLARPVERPAWRLWTYRTAAVVLGRSQRSNLGAVAAASPLPVHLRSAGGGAVLVGPWMLGVSAALPATHPLAQGGPVASYRWLGEALAGALREAGVHAARALPPDVVRQVDAEPALAWACFGGLSPWEAVVGARKITGLAQVRRRTGVLLVAGVLVEPPPWTQLCRALGQPADHAARLASRTTAASEHAAGDLRATLLEGLPARLDAALLMN